MSTREAKPIAFHQALGARIKQLREQYEVSQEMLAYAARRAGLPWRRTLVAQIEIGKRHVTLEEFFVLPAIFSVFAGKALQWLDVLPEGQPVSLTKDLSCDDALALKLLVNSQGQWEPKIEAHFDSPQTRLEKAVAPAEIQQEEAIHQAALGDAETKAARALRTDAIDISRAAFQQWGRSLTAQRDHLLAEKGVDPAADARHAQAIRGHLTRQLLAQLKPALRKGGKKRRKKSI